MSDRQLNWSKFLPVKSTVRGTEIASSGWRITERWPLITTTTSPISIIVIGASAGGVSALRDLAAGLAEPLPAAVLVVIHIGAQPSEMPALLNAAGVMPAKHAEDGELIRPGRFYIAPPDRHLMVAGGRVRLTRGPKENWARPAIDPLFRSAADEYGRAAIGVILTGNLNDGTAGLLRIKQKGGLAIAQDPDDAAHPAMPRSAAFHVDLDHCLPLVGIPALLSTLVAQKEELMADETHDAPASGSVPACPSAHDGGPLERPVTITCPDCGGALRRTETASLAGYACHIGHTYSADAMAAAQFDDMERILRTAERVLNERAEFCRQMAEDEDAAGSALGSAWRAAAGEAMERAYVLRAFIEQDWINPQPALPSVGKGPAAEASGARPGP